MNLLISYPNSGRTWYSTMLKEAGANLYLAHYGALHELEDMISFVEKYPSKFTQDNIILLYREPKDHIVSNYFQLKYRFGYDIPEISAFIRCSRYGVEKVIQYNLFWKTFTKCKSKLVVSYEQLQADPLNVLTQTLNFCGEVIEEHWLRQIIKHNSFDNTHQRELENDIHEKDWYKRTDRNNPESFKARRGIVGGYIDYLSQDDIDYINDLVTGYNYSTAMKA